MATIPRSEVFEGAVLRRLRNHRTIHIIGQINQVTKIYQVMTMAVDSGQYYLCSVIKYSSAVMYIIADS